jgi:hypothetical protein
MNVKLLRMVKKHILEEPRRFDMGTFGSTFASRFHFKSVTGEALRNFPPCGTVACIAGWAIGVNASKPKSFFRKISYGQIAPLATAELELSIPEKDRLFYQENWPTRYYTAYAKAKSPADRARVAARRIEHFIKTNGAE